MTNPDACKSNELAGHCDEQASQNNEGNVVTTRSGRVVKSRRDNENFIYY